MTGWAGDRVDAVIDLTVYGDPASCRAAAAALDRQHRATYATTAEMNYGLTTTQNYWQGVAGENFRRYLEGAHGDAEDLDRKTCRAMWALEDFAGALDKVRGEMAQARQEAEVAGLVVVGDEITHPYPTERPSPLAVRPPLVPEPPRIDETDPKMRAYRDCEARIAYARGLEDNAHDALRDMAADVAKAPFLEHWAVKVGLIPASSEPEQVALWAGNSGLFAAGGVAAWATQVKFGGLYPVINGVRGSAADLASWQRMGASFRSRNWVPHSGMEAPYARWTATGRVLNRAGGVLAGATAAFDQWGADSDDPTMSENERVARAGTVGVTTGGGAYGGALMGAQAGAAIGSVFPGPGTVIGGAVGGIVGGVIGSQVGQAAGTAIIDGLGAGVKKLKLW